MRWLSFIVLVLLASGEAAAAESLGRLFFTPAQRAQLDTARAQRSRASLSAEVEAEAAAAPETVTYQGVVQRSDGKNTIWINDRSVREGEASGRLPPANLRPDGSVVLELPQGDRVVELRVGQRVDLYSGAISEPFTPTPTAAHPPSAKSASPAAARSAAVVDSRTGEPNSKSSTAAGASATRDASAASKTAPKNAATQDERLKAALEQIQRQGEAEQANAPSR